MPPRFLGRLPDVWVTGWAWIYFLLGYIIAFLPRVLWAAIWRRGDRRARRVQAINSQFFRGFFWLLRVTSGGRVRLQVAPEIRALSGSVLVCNHISYLDPLAFVAVFGQQLTVVKPVFFRVPLFGAILRWSGSFAPRTQKQSGASLLGQLDSVKQQLEAGGRLYIFPEGHRSTDGALGDFQAGAFKLARQLGVGVELLTIEGTGTVFTPGQGLFHTTGPVVMELHHLGSLTADELAAAPSLRGLVADVEARYRAALDAGPGAEPAEPG